MDCLSFSEDQLLRVSKHAPMMHGWLRSLPNAIARINGRRLGLV
jgi:hypothetical protein